jgi:nanoRNase/pAp phosphatase (c-di-AMP/oligoRNAs hydrolase)
MNYGFAKEFTEIKKELEKSREVLIVAHSAPDGDTVGSSFALKEYLVSGLKKKPRPSLALIFCLNTSRIFLEARMSKFQKI